MEDQLRSLKKLIDSIVPIGEEDWQALSAIWHPYASKRKELLTIAGEKERYLYFIYEGVQRIFYADDAGREATVIFTYGPSFGGVIDSLMLQQPSKYYYETLSSSAFLRTSWQELSACMEHRPMIAYMVRQGITIALSGVLERSVELQCFSSEEKFKMLLKRSPHILQLVPQKYLANYIGIEATNFSKFINRLKI